MIKISVLILFVSLVYSRDPSEHNAFDLGRSVQEQNTKNCKQVSKYSSNITSVIAQVSMFTLEPRKSILIQQGDQSVKSLRDIQFLLDRACTRIDNSFLNHIWKMQRFFQAKACQTQANNVLQQWYTHCKTQFLNCKQTQTKDEVKQQKDSQQDLFVNKNLAKTKSVAEQNVAIISSLKQSNISSSNIIVSQPAAKIETNQGILVTKNLSSNDDLSG